MTIHNPVNQQRAIKKLDRDLTIRLSRAEQKIKLMLRSIPRKTRTIVDIQNRLAVNLVITEYELSPAEIEQMIADIQRILNQELLDSPQGEDIPPNWYYKPDIEQPYRAGTIEEINETNHLIEAAIIAGLFARRILPRTLSIEEVLLSSQYQEALNAVYAENFGFVKSLSNRTASQVYGVINDGISAGSSVTQISRDITDRFDVSKSSANRIAQTEVNRAFNDAKINAGKLISSETGVKTAVRHISALLSTTRPHHARRHQLVYTREAQEAWWNEGSNRINCFIEGTRVNGRFKGGLKSFYRGVVVEIMTRDGRNLTCTPNHKIMTNSGLIDAAKLRKGDNLIAYGIQNKNSIGVIDLNIDEIDPRIENVFASLLKVGDSSMIRPMSINFNGYERFINKNVERVLSKSELIFGNDTLAFKALDYLSFKHSNAPGVRFSSFFQRVKTVFSSTSCNISVLSQKLIGLFIRLFESNELALLVSSSDNALLFEDSVNNRAGNSESVGKTENGFPVNVSFDEVVGINTRYFVGHVYDLQESSGLIIANGIIASNCYCSVQTVLLDGKNKPMVI